MGLIKLIDIKRKNARGDNSSRQGYYLNNSIMKNENKGHFALALG